MVQERKCLILTDGQRCVLKPTKTSIGHLLWPITRGITPWNHHYHLLGGGRVKGPHFKARCRVKTAVYHSCPLIYTLRKPKFGSFFTLISVNSRMKKFRALRAKYVSILRQGRLWWGTTGRHTARTLDTPIFQCDILGKIKIKICCASKFSTRFHEDVISLRQCSGSNPLQPTP